MAFEESHQFESNMEKAMHYTSQAEIAGVVSFISCYEMGRGVYSKVRPLHQGSWMQ